MCVCVCVRVRARAHARMTVLMSANTYVIPTTYSKQCQNIDDPAVNSRSCKDHFITIHTLCNPVNYTYEVREESVVVTLRRRSNGIARYVSDVCEGEGHVAPKCLSNDRSANTAAS